MSFINKKEEVIDVTLTRFGRHLLAKGKFKPKYYQFFDDDILYNSTCGGFGEHQNDAENRILNETPRLRSTGITMPLSTGILDEPYVHDDEEAFTFSKKNIFDSSIQDRILLYPMGSCELHLPDSPAFEIKNYDCPFETSYDFLQLTSSGVIKNIPQVDMKPRFVLRNDISEITPGPGAPGSSYDIATGEVVFDDNSKILVSPSEILFDIIEKNNFYEKENFILEVYEVTENEDRDDSLRKIEDIRQINELFHIKTDEHVQSVSVRTGRANNYYRGDN